MSTYPPTATRKRRVIRQEDANVPGGALGMDIEQWLAHRFDLIDQGAPVDAIFWDIGFAEDTYAVYNGSKLLSPERHPGIERWRLQGVDWVKRLVESSHDRGIEAFWSHRICPVDFSSSSSHDNPVAPNPLKQAHPDWINPCWWSQGLWNLANSDLRQHKLKYFAELFELYDLDGLQIDFARHTPCLPPGREWENRDHATEFVRQTRQLLSEIGRRRDKPLQLAVRVAETLAGNHSDGFEVERWAAEGLVDIFVLGGRTTLVDLDSFRKITTGKNIQLCPCFDGHHTDDGYYFPPVEHFRGVFSNWIRQGADCIGLFNWTCAREEIYDQFKLPGDMKSPTQRQALLELADLSSMSERPRSYAVERRGGYPWAQNYLYRNADKPLPAKTNSSGFITVPIHISERVSPATVRPELTLVFWQCQAGDIARVSINGNTVTPDYSITNWRDGQIYCDQPQPHAGARWRYPITNYDLLKQDFRFDPKILLRGENSIAVEFRPTANPSGTWEKAEILIVPDVHTSGTP